MKTRLSTLWSECHIRLQDQLSSMDFSTWIKPLEADFPDDKTMVLYAPNRFIKGWVEEQFLAQINKLCQELTNEPNFLVKVLEGTLQKAEPIAPQAHRVQSHTKIQNNNGVVNNFRSNLNPNHVFDNFVEGKSNQLARAVAQKVALNPGEKNYNPLFLYGGTGLGKTHLLHAIGNNIMQTKENARVVYLHAERFMQSYVKALQADKMDNFKKFYRSVDALLIDDIQFFAGKDSTQEEFFHIFNSLSESSKQIILTSDRYPKEIEKIEDRLKSRFGWGLTIAIEPPDLETRVAILLKKAEEHNIVLPEEVAFFIGQKLRTNVRELEGALNRVHANAEFTGKAVTIDFVREALKDMLALQDKLVTIENIQKVVAEYFRIKVSDLKSKSKKRSIARPRQLAMALAKELTNRSLPEIGKEFGDRDHTTVLHACKKVVELRNQDTNFQEDWSNLIRTLSV